MNKEYTRSVVEKFKYRMSEIYQDNYSMFYVAQAFLLQEGLSFSRTPIQYS
jgi:uncharacterized protein (UPF0332 family)